MFKTPDSAIDPHNIFPPRGARRARCLDNQLTRGSPSQPDGRKAKLMTSQPAVGKIIVNE